MWCRRPEQARPGTLAGRGRARRARPHAPSTGGRSPSGRRGRPPSCRRRRAVDARQGVAQLAQPPLEREHARPARAGPSGALRRPPRSPSRRGVPGAATASTIARNVATLPCRDRDARRRRAGSSRAAREPGRGGVPPRPGCSRATSVSAAADGAGALEPRRRARGGGRDCRSPTAKPATRARNGPRRAQPDGEARSARRPSSVLATRCPRGPTIVTGTRARGGKIEPVKRPRRPPRAADRRLEREPVGGHLNARLRRLARGRGGRHDGRVASGGRVHVLDRRTFARRRRRRGPSGTWRRPCRRQRDESGASSARALACDGDGRRRRCRGRCEGERQTQDERPPHDLDDTETTG